MSAAEPLNRTRRGTSVAKAQPSASASWRTTEPLPLSQILTAALDSFYENGYHGATVRDIARRVGVTVPALYYYHQNKEAMLYSVLDQSIDRLNDLCERALDDAGPDPLSRFANLVECLVLYMSHSSKTAYLDHEIRALTPEHHRDHAVKRKRIETLVVETIESGIASGAFRISASGESGRALVGMVQSIAMWFRPNGPQSPEQLARTYLMIAAHLVGASPRALTILVGR